MRSGNFDFQWFEKEDARRALRVSISKDGKMRLGRELRRKLPPYIRVGFDAKTRTLAIAKGNETDILWPKMGIFNMRRLAAQITKLGFTLPVFFQLEDRPEICCYCGKVLPRKQKPCPDAAGRTAYDAEQLMVLYRPLIESLVSQTAKTTPLPERRSCAWEAFCEAVSTYTAGQGEMEPYLEACVRRALVRHNKAFVSTAQNRSLDAPLTNAEGDSFCLYDVISDPAAGGLDRVEAKIMEDQFAGSLPPKEKQLYRMVCAGYPVSEIAAELGLQSGEVQAMGHAIGEKRSIFYKAG